MESRRYQSNLFGGNPFLPAGEHIADGEPHAFGDRVYLFGSHDKEGGDKFCELDYVCWSAPVDDLTDWRCDGTIYCADQDPPWRKDSTIVEYQGTVPLCFCYHGRGSIDFKEFIIT